MRYALNHGWLQGRGGVYVAPLALVLALVIAGCASGAGSGATAGARMTPTTTVPPLVLTPTAPPASPMSAMLAALAQGAVGAAARAVTVTYDTSSEQATVTVTITGDLPNTDARIAAAYARVKVLSFQEENALWTSGLPLRQVMVIIMGPTQGEYADIVDGWYGIVVVGEATARRIPWTSATPDGVWSAYDQSWLRTRFDLFDDIPPAPTATGA